MHSHGRRWRRPHRRQRLLHGLHPSVCIWRRCAPCLVFLLVLLGHSAGVAKFAFAAHHAAAPEEMVMAWCFLKHDLRLPSCLLNRTLALDCISFALPCSVVACDSLAYVIKMFAGSARLVQNALNNGLKRRQDALHRRRNCIHAGSLHDRHHQAASVANSLMPDALYPELPSLAEAVI